MHLGSSRQKVLQLCKPPLRPLFKFGHSLSENSFLDVSHSGSPVKLRLIILLTLPNVFHILQRLGWEWKSLIAPLRSEIFYKHCSAVLIKWPSGGRLYAPKCVTPVFLPGVIDPASAFNDIWHFMTFGIFWQLAFLDNLHFMTFDIWWHWYFATSDISCHLRFHVFWDLSSSLSSSS